MEENNRKKINPLLIVGAITIVALLGFYFVNGMKKSPETNQETAQTQKQEEIVPTKAQANNEAKTITMDAGAFYYSVKEIKVKKGDKVTITFTSKDMMHDFNIDELGVKSEIAKAGETKTVEFTADKVGTFEYYCSVGQHRKMGQIGKLIVE